MIGSRYVFLYGDDPPGSLRQAHRLHGGLPVPRFVLKYHRDVMIRVPFQAGSQRKPVIQRSAQALNDGDIDRVRQPRLVSAQRPGQILGFQASFRDPPSVLRQRRGEKCSRTSPVRMYGRLRRPLRGFPF